MSGLASHKKTMQKATVMRIYITSNVMNKALKFGGRGVWIEKVGNQEVRSLLKKII